MAGVERRGRGLQVDLDVDVWVLGRRVGWHWSTVEADVAASARNRSWSTAAGASKSSLVYVSAFKVRSWSTRALELAPVFAVRSISSLHIHTNYL